MRPSSLMPEELFTGDLPKAQFDICVALVGYLGEAKAREEAEAPPSGSTTSRRQVNALARRAHQDVLAMEREEKKRKAAEGG